MATVYLRRRKKVRGEIGAQRLAADRATALCIIRNKGRRGTFGKGLGEHLPVLNQLR